MRWTLYTRRGCGLCEEAEDLLAGVPDVVCVDVDSRPELVQRYGLRVPVLCEGERVLLEGRLSEVAVASLLSS
jgi:glutaredoxin